MIMYNDIKLEKSLYNLSGKSFTQALCELDPDEGYAGSDLRGLDAYERQLKRFDIRVCGADSDRVEKFFETAQSAVLFPEFVRRAVKQGMDSTVLPEIVAAFTATASLDYRGFEVSDNGVPYSTPTAQSAALPETAITLGSELVSLKKFGRVLCTSYEAIRQQRLDVFAVTLRAVGTQLSRAVTGQAVDVLTAGTTPVSMGGSAFSYAELIAFWGRFTDFDLTTVLASPTTLAKILAFEEMDYAHDDALSGGAITTRFGVRLVKASGVPDDLLIGLDKSCALEMVNGSGVVLETDKLLDRQVDRTVISVTTGFSKIMKGAVQVLDIG